jgi:phage tail-like protein
MAVSRPYPYNQFNFQVKFGSTEAAFQEVSGLSMEVHVAEYRAGSASTNAPIKVTGLSKFGDVTFKRGVVGDISSFYQRINNVSGGGGNSPTGGETVVINLMDDTNGTVVQTWTLSNARAIKLTGPSFNGKGTDVAIEELVMLTEGIAQS